MQKIVLTYPTFFPDELRQILFVLRDERVCLHIRKPDATAEEYKALLHSIPYKYHKNIVLHDYHCLSDAYTVRGLHFSTQNRNLAENCQFSGTKSTSCHSIDELSAVDGQFDYAFLSPIFPSISKQGYQGNLNMEDVKAYLLTARKTKVIALGGLDVDKLKMVETWGFDGVAYLGAIWNLNKKK